MPTPQELENFAKFKLAGFSLDEIQKLLGATTSDLPLQSESPFDFRDRAEQEVSDSGFFDKNLEIAKKQIQLAKDQQKASKELVAKQEQENFGAFIGVQDRGFARRLSNAQGGFAGRGTATSGFRGRRIEDIRQGQEDVISQGERGVRQAGETREQQFSQFLGRSDLEMEGRTLDINRARESETLQRQQQFAQQARAQNQRLQEIDSRNFARTFGQGFIGDKLNA